MEREKLMMGEMSELAARIIELVQEHGRLSIGDAVKLTGANRNTLKQHFRALVVCPIWSVSPSTIRTPDCAMACVANSKAPMIQIASLIMRPS